ncbi:hypothetical protein D9J03_18990 [Escherichia coli]|nr:hypothetical protein [Escherichia coli]MHT29525.1 hypothetical protein [Escherichia coli]OOJ14992.1 hypothetical protein BMT97_23950 [Escherichia coli]
MKISMVLKAGYGSAEFCNKLLCFDSSCSFLPAVRCKFFVVSTIADTTAIFVIVLPAYVTYPREFVPYVAQT